MRRIAGILSISFITALAAACGSGSSKGTPESGINSAPVADFVTISTGDKTDVHVGDVLNGQYQYTDENGDPEGASRFRWLRDGVEIKNATNQSYTLAKGDAGYAISFEVTPQAATGDNDAQPVESAPITALNTAPTAVDIAITTPALNTFHASYTYNDADDDAQGATKIQWRLDDIAIDGAVNDTYVLGAQDVGKMLSISITPIAQTGEITGPTNSANIQRIGSLTPDPRIAANVKQLTFNTNTIPGATRFRLMQDIGDGNAYIALMEGGAASITYDISVHRFNWNATKFKVEACDASRCITSPELSATQEMLTAIGYFKASNSGATDRFGNAVALSADGNTMAIGAFDESSKSSAINGDGSNNEAPSSGAVYVYTRLDGVWTLQAYIKASNTGANDQFGFAVALSSNGNTLLVGAPGEASNATGIDGDQTDNSKQNSGAAYVYVRANAAWTQQAYVKASNTDAEDKFGFSLALSGDGSWVAIGAVGEASASKGIDVDQNDNTKLESGAVYIFKRGANGWGQQAYVKASNTDAGDIFGSSIALSQNGDTLAVGAVSEGSNAVGIDDNQADNSKLESGAVYVYTRNVDAWSQQAYVKASNTDQYDWFGVSVALSGDGNRMAVGASDESSNASGIDGNQGDNTAPSSGAVYLFARDSKGTWIQDSYIKASTNQKISFFGWQVTLSTDGNTLAVGAPGEASNSVGINGDQTNRASGGSGAVYVFDHATTWIQKAYIKASNTGKDDNFGTVTALSSDGGTLAVGALGESSSATGVNGNQLDNSANLAGAVYLY